ncbi:MAG: cupin domain-containing protein [Oscillospiraceae bacterium]|nr:cupin domain-containing protein [Oscillospiraceae bacterium]
MKNEFLIRMDVPEDCVRVSDSAGIYYRLFHEPVTGLLKNEIDCMQFHVPEEKTIEYHEHTFGSETFFVSQGRFFCYCMGRGFTMGPGDVFHIQPWMGHSFTPIEPESRLNIMFMGIDQQAAITKPWQHIVKNFPGVYEEPAFNEAFHTAYGYNTKRRTVPTAPEEPAELVTQLRRSGMGLREHNFDGIKMQLKVALYETGGVKEVWEYFMKPGFFCDWDNFLPEYRVFYVTEGKVRCKVKTSATETLDFIAEKENIVFIPPYNPFRFEVVEEARMYDMDCSARLQDLCEEIEALRSRNSPKVADRESTYAVFKAYGFNCTDVGYDK